MDEILKAIKAVNPIAADAEYEGDLKGWHIRLARRVKLDTGQTIEIWQLFKGDEPESSPMPKSIVLGWLMEEQKKGH